MPTILIDDREYAYADGPGQPTLLQFAIENGVDIPYFCYHPAMSVPTNCRMCLVEVGYPAIDRATGQPVRDDKGQPVVNWGRKPATSCNQALSPGMLVRTHLTSPAIKKAQAGVLEFILINHPLDCPICDQAGECPLQINTFKFGPEGSRFELRKVHKPKRVQLGPNVMLDAERCINCTRCTRFTEEISKTNQLSIIARGDKNFPSAGPGRTFDDPYSMNVVDLCPVGALTSADFRFKARAWEMNYTPGISTTCSKGTNVYVWVRDNRVLRLTPRYNPHVNQYWMPDEDRLDYSKFNDNRVSGIKVKGDVPADFEQGLGKTAELLKQHQGRILAVGSGHASLESNYLLRALMREIGVTEIHFAKHHDPSKDDGFLRTADRTPNSAACRLLGFKEADADKLGQLAGDSRYSLVLVMEDDAVASALVQRVSKPVIAMAHQHFAGHDKTEILLPAATAVEGVGVFINDKNLPQFTLQAKQIRQMTPEMWMAMPKSRLDAGGVAIDNWRNLENIIDCLPSWMLLCQIAQKLNIKLDYANHAALYRKIQSEFDLLRNLNLPKRIRRESFKMSQFEFAIDLKDMQNQYLPQLKA